jgi:hypothetical protein
MVQMSSLRGDLVPVTGPPIAQVLGCWRPLGTPRRSAVFVS